MGKWEYKVDYGMSLGGRLKLTDFQEHLNMRGEEGWELISILSAEEIWTVFKRPLTETH